MRALKLAIGVVAVGLLFVAKTETPASQAHASETRASESGAIAAVLDSFHAAAARADAGAYFSLFAADGVFIGTDATERWTVPEFKAYAKTAFDAGQGWTYVPQSRHITVEAGEHPHVAWFDELLNSKEFGETRGTGVLMKIKGEWKVEQYSLSLPIPNDAIHRISDEIRAAAQAGKKTP